MDRTPLFLAQGQTITAEHVARLFVLLAGPEPTAEEMERVRSTLAARRPAMNPLISHNSP